MADQAYFRKAKDLGAIWSVSYGERRTRPWTKARASSTWYEHTMGVELKYP